MSFPRYEKYKDSGVEWLGDVPEGWNTSRVKFDSYVKARVGWHGLKSDEFTDEGPYLVTGSDFKNRTVDWRNCYHCTLERYEQDKYIQLKEGDLLITKDGTIGKLILVERIPDKATLNSGIFVVRPLDQKYSTQFYFWLLHSSVFNDFISLHKTGSTIGHLYQETFQNLPYALPSLSEQTQIARFLDHETARIDALIAEQQRLIELLKEKRQAVISHAVTKGLDPNVPMKDSGVEWLGEVPEHWEVGALRWYATIQGGIAKGKDYADRETIALPYLRVANVQSGFVDLTEVKEISVLATEVERYRLRVNDVLMNEGGDNDKLGRGTVWKGQISPCLHQNHVFAIRPNKWLQPNWLATFTQSEQARSYFYLNSKQSTNLASISASNVMSLSLPLPSLSEQQQVHNITCRY